MINEETRALHIEVALLRGVKEEDLLEKSADIGRKAIVNTLLLQPMFLNGPKSCRYSYGAADGSLAMRGWMTVDCLPSACDIVLASDGYPELHGTLFESEDRLAAILAVDPLMFRGVKATKGCYKGLKSFDDRAYLRIRMEG
ncbi:hypothetical protein ACOI1H_15995 [Loktanella sp. DJP18]|uniref:hypothetical protein n=1 Tax=Loktanella sp. DJP18 TaxID=3409788 RepID=UPI003BB6D910